MKRDTKGQQVKTFKHSEPQPDLSYKEVVGKVYFIAGDGDFVIYAPAHIAALGITLLKPEDENRDKHWRSGQVRSKTMAGAIDYYQALRLRYTEMMKAEHRSKVIVLQYESNLRHIEGHSGLYRAERQRGWGMPAPGLSLSYAILFEAAGKLYREQTSPAWDDRPAETYFHYECDAQGALIIPWTEERETFFAQIVAQMEKLIVRIDIFTRDLAQNVDTAIASMQSLALPAPSVHRDEDVA